MEEQPGYPRPDDATAPPEELVTTMDKRKIDPAALHFDDDTVVEDIDLAYEVIIVDGERLTDERADAIVADVLAKARARNR
ncbi:hypothetical protein [[Mycobacterium] crassicus]|uniref:Uncharacterized protein n=1 Tax=[Mycobacterium] crassicus TaxID=2872309 RepID=A0ABU5XIW1_9MYCO|nr:hypothetical protein [Mycolicibacter sp. MYC098]MEB3022059.1 hypothetical protein [Mycolicibacter sp. MYC098]